MRKHGYGVALYPPPEVGGYKATEDKKIASTQPAIFLKR
ncbi:hypothetical protein ENHY17A_100286 [Moraxellaceae bacterium 17A]|nr:hypothetical protein ENHY17A_100286 [Moraxellaceae bacterium 17A]